MNIFVKPYKEQKCEDSFRNNRGAWVRDMGGGEVAGMESL